MRKSRIVLLVLASIICFSLDCRGEDVVLLRTHSSDFTKEHGKENRSLDVPLCAFYDNNILDIVAYFTIEEVSIHISNERGNTVYDECIATLDKGHTYIPLPDVDSTQTYLIEITFGDTYMWGYINEKD